jgi:hypothetical protein
MYIRSYIDKIIEVIYVLNCDMYINVLDNHILQELNIANNLLTYLPYEWCDIEWLKSNMKNGEFKLSNEINPSLRVILIGNSINMTSNIGSNNVIMMEE